MTFRSRLIKIKKKTAVVGDLYDIDLSTIPKDMTFDEYLQSDLFKKERDKLFKTLKDNDIENKYLGNNSGEYKVVYVLEDDIKPEKEA